jgi:hypothetical protein
LKTYLIVLLLIVNLVFAAALVNDIMEGNRARDAGLRDLVSVYRSSGVTLAEGAIKELRTPPVSVRIVRSAESEQRLAERLLGPGTLGEDLGGSIFYYTGMSGVARFRLDGTFEVSLPYYSTTGGKLESFAEDLAATMGVKVRLLDTVGSTLHYAVLHGGSDVVNQRISFSFGSTIGVTVAGVYVVGAEQPGDEYNYADALTASLKFLREIESGGILCGAVDRVDSVYLFSGSAYIPAWRFSGDSGVYLLISMTGELTVSLLNYSYRGA